MKEDIEKIIYYGTLAPSGDNCQPWQFEIADNKIRIYNVPEKDRSVYNLNQMATHISHGALIENIDIASHNLGYETAINLLPTEGGNNLIADIEIKGQGCPLAGQIDLKILEKRSTNRKNFETKGLTSKEKEEVLRSSQELGWGEVRLSANRKELEELAKILSLNEKLVFEVRELHHFFFKNINWTEEEEKNRREGMYVKTLELNKFQEIMFKILRNWKFLNLINKLGFSKFIGKENADIHNDSGAIGVVMIDRSDEGKDFINLGRLLERVWLNATRLDLNLQLITGLSFFEERFLLGNLDHFKPNQIEKIKQANDRIKEILRINKDKIFIPFRIGHGEKPSARSLRLDPKL